MQASEGSGDAPGIAVGIACSSGNEVRISEELLRLGVLAVGEAGAGRSSFVANLLRHRFELAVSGGASGPVLVMGPFSPEVEDILRVVPRNLSGRVRMVDFGDPRRVPALNLLDPLLFPARGRCIDTLVGTCRALWRQWDDRLDYLLRRSLSILYSFNSSPATPRSRLATVLDVVELLKSGSGSPPSRFQSLVLERVQEPELVEWLRSFLSTAGDSSRDLAAPVQSHFGAYAANRRSCAAMGQRESLVDFHAMLEDGLIVLVSTGSGLIGSQPSALIGSALVSAFESFASSRPSVDGGPPGPLVVCDEYRSFAGVDWDYFLSDASSLGTVLSTPSLVRGWWGGGTTGVCGPVRACCGLPDAGAGFPFSCLPVRSPAVLGSGDAAFALERVLSVVDDRLWGWFPLEGGGLFA